MRHPAARLAGSFWIVNETPAASDAIVILGDDNYGGDRATRAAEIFKAGMAPRVVASGRYLRPYASIAELEQHDLTDRGVPATAIVRFDQHAENTKDEAVALAQLISARGWKRILWSPRITTRVAPAISASAHFLPAQIFSLWPPLIPNTIPTPGGTPAPE